MTKTAEKPYPLGSHIHIKPADIRDGETPPPWTWCYIVLTTCAGQSNRFTWVVQIKANRFLQINIMGLRSLKARAREAGTPTWKGLVCHRCVALGYNSEILVSLKMSMTKRK